MQRRNYATLFSSTYIYHFLFFRINFKAQLLKLNIVSIDMVTKKITFKEDPEILFGTPVFPTAFGRVVIFCRVFGVIRFLTRKERPDRIQ